MKGKRQIFSRALLGYFKINTLKKFSQRNQTRKPREKGYKYKGKEEVQVCVTADDVIL